jgi:hypothetical protein
MLRLADALELAPDERIEFEVAGKPAPRYHLRVDRDNVRPKEQSVQLAS